MYIEQVINACDTFYPNPYTISEKYFWCDELSKLLKIKYNTEYIKSELFEADGKYLLPEGISSSMLDKIICGDRVLKKQDFREFGILCSDKQGRGEIILPENQSYKRVYAIYIEPYENIRNISFSGVVTFGKDYFLIDENLFRPGDILKITIGEDVLEDVFVLDFLTDTDTAKIKVITGGKEFEEGDVNCTIERKVMEETVCPPPHDSMYIDYILGKICYYQNDFPACNNHMSLFNSKLADYEKWIKSHPIVDYSVSKIRNWW